MSTLQHTTRPTSRFRSGRYLALLATGIILVVAAVTIIAIASSGGAKTTQAAPAPAAASSVRSSAGPSAGLSELVRSHMRSDRATR
jgi:hypothetical protein